VIVGLQRRSAEDEVCARGVLRHTKEEHVDLALGTARRYSIVYNVAGAPYNLSGKGPAPLTGLQPRIAFHSQPDPRRVRHGYFFNIEQSHEGQFKNRKSSPGCLDHGSMSLVDKRIVLLLDRVNSILP